METTEDPLSQLADIHLPGEVEAWPPAVGWWVLAALLAAALVAGVRRLFALVHRRRREAAALRELEDAWQRYCAGARQEGGQNQAGLDFLAQVNAVLRRVALYHYPEAEVAGLTGRHWLAFLDACDGAGSFTNGPGRALADGQYRPSFAADAEGLYLCARAWIRNRYRRRPAVQPNVRVART